MFSAGISKQIAASGGPVDAQFNYVTALLHGDGTNGAQNNTFVDTSGNSLAITRNGTPTQGTLSPYGTLWSNYFDGASASNLPVPSNPVAATGAFTVECWVYVTNSAVSQAIYSQYSAAAGRWQIFWNDVTNKFSFVIAATSYNSTNTYTGNAWHHIAWVRDGSNNLSFYIDGVRDSTNAGVSTSLETINPTIANRAGNATPYYGYISNLRITNTSVYTGTSYTIPITPLTAITGTTLLTCQNNSFKDNSTNNYTMTPNGSGVSVQRFNPFLPTSSQAYSTSVIGGSAYFNGSTDYLSIPANTNLDPGSGNFTIEAWIYPNAYPASGVGAGIVQRSQSSGYALYSVTLRSTGAIEAYMSLNNALSVPQIITAGNAPLNAWTHVAFVKVGLTYTLYVNGASVGSVTNGSPPANNSGLITKIGYADAYFTGYINDVRLTPTAVYNGNFTPPNTLLGNNQLANANGSPSNALTAPITNSSQVIFNGTNQYLNLGGQTAFAFGSGSFTIEFWFYLKAASQTTWFCDFRNTNNTTQPGIALSTGTLQYYVNGAGQITGAANPSINAWHHLAVVRNGSSTVMYLDGVQTGSTFTDSVVYTVDASRPTIGSGGYTVGYYLNGYISNFRIVKGTAVYTSAFTPPTSPLTAITNTSLLTCQTPTIIDNSTNAFTITNNNTATTSLAIGLFSGTYAGVFNGTSQYLTVPTATAFNLSSATAWTIETWIYTSGSTVSGTIIQKDGISGTNYPQYSIQLNGSGYIIGFIGRSDGISIIQSITSSILLPTNSWVHIAFVLNSGTLYLYQNGVQVASASKTVTMLDSARALYIGYQQGGGASTYFTGNISNLRLINGTALYTSSFFTPQSPLTAITNTSLLTCQSSTFVDNSTNAFTITNNGSSTLTNLNGPFGNANTPQLLLNNTNAGIYDNGMMNDLVTVGSAQISTSVKKYGTGSLSFNGSSDYLSIPDNYGFVFGSGDFTVEAWIYPTQVVASEAPIFKLFDTNNIIELRQNGNKLDCYLQQTNPSITLSTGTIAMTVNTWNHVAFVRSGTTTYTFVNGVLDQTKTSQTQNLTSLVTTKRIGTNQTASFFFSGYIDDLRITKGYARYTANFTPPTAAFPNYGR